jgi:hypothetical protein
MRGGKIGDRTNAVQLTDNSSEEMILWDHAGERRINGYMNEVSASETADQGFESRADKSAGIHVTRTYGITPAPLIFGHGAPEKEFKVDVRT